MQIKEVNVSEIKEYAKNAKKHPEKQVVAIATSIKKFGFRQPLVLDKNMEVVIGHGRLAAAKMLRMETVPCVMADDLTEEQIKALRIADNKTNESEWDFGLLGEELAQLVDIDMTDLGFNEAEILELQIDDSPEEIPVGNPVAVQPVQPVGGIAPIPNYSGNPISEPHENNEAPYSGVSPITKDELSAYAQNAESLITRRVIIVYRTDEEEAYLKNLLGVAQENQLNVVFDAKNLMMTEDSNAEPEE